MEAPSPKTESPETTLIRTRDDSRAPLVFQLGNADQNSSGTFSFGVLWKSLRQRLLLTIPLGILLSAAACAALWYYSQDQYVATARLEIKDKHDYLAFPNQEGSQGFSQTQVERLRAPHLIRQAIENENLTDLEEIKQLGNSTDPVQWIRQRLKVAQVGKSQFYDVSFATRVPASAKLVVDAVVNAFMKDLQSEIDENRRTMLEILTDEKKNREGDIENKRAALRAVVKLAGGDTAAAIGRTGAIRQRPAAEGDVVLGILHEKLIDADVEIHIKSANLAYLREQVEQPVSVSDEQIESELANDPQVVKLETKLRELRGNLAVTKQDTLPAKGYQKNIESLQEELNACRSKRRIEIAKLLADQKSSQQRQLLARAEAELESQKNIVASLREKLKGQRVQKSEDGDKSLEVEFADSELQRAESVSQRIADRIVALRIEGRAKSPVRIYAPAIKPEYPEGPSLTKKLGMVGFAGFLAPMVLFVGWDLLYRRVYEREQLQQEVKVKFVSEVAALPIRSLIPRPGSSKEFKQQSLMFEESVNALRTTLSVDKTLDDCKVFVMASAVSGEGKTNLSSQLAMSWSQAEPGKVILVDADLRSPNVHDLFEVRPGPGLAEVLRGECSLEEVTIMDWGDRLYIIPAGNLGSDSASQLFSGAPFANVIAQLRSQYNKIMIDVPPVLCASETLLIAKQADGVLMCALHDYSRTGQIKQAYDRLALAGVNLVGAVLNGAPTRQYSYNYRGYGVN